MTYLTDIIRGPKKQSESPHTPEEIASAIVCCFDHILSIPDCFSGNDTLPALGNLLIDLLLSNEIKFLQSIQHLNFLMANLSILNKVVQNNHDWQETKIGYLLGISRAYILTGIQGVPQQVPQKINVSHQNLVDPGQVNTKNKGGKVTKTRKLRTIAKSKKPDPVKKSSNNPGNAIDCKYSFHRN